MDQEENRPSLDPLQFSASANRNALIWAFGNGLASSTLIYYLAIELGASAATVGWIIAAPKLVGLLRLYSVSLLDRFKSRKKLCLIFYCLSAACLFALPSLCNPKLVGSQTAALWLLVFLWCLYHLFQYLATVVLWDWFNTKVNPTERGVFVGNRQAWLTVGQLVGYLIAGITSWYLIRSGLEIPRIDAYRLLSNCGAVFFFFALLPLLSMKDSPTVNHQSNSWQTELRTIFSPEMRRLLYYGLWFSTANGLSMSLMSVYVYKALHLPLFITLSIPAAMRLGQSVLSPILGENIHRIGIKRIMIFSQVLVSCGPLAYLLGLPGYMLAHFLWIAYAGINVCLPVVMLNLTDDQHSANRIAGYFALTGFVFGLSTIFGGVLGDYFVPDDMQDYPAAYYLYFCFAWLLRLSSVIPLLFLITENQSTQPMKVTTPTPAVSS